MFYFITVTTCPNECNFQMFKLTDRRYSLKRIQLTISDEIKWFNPCSDTESSRHERSLYINCASWNASKSQIFFICNKYLGLERNKIHVFPDDVTVKIISKK